MKERIEKQIQRLDEMRGDVLESYLMKLEDYSVSDGSMKAIEWAGRLHDLDKHITNLHGELKRLEAAVFLNCNSTEVSRG